MAALLHITCELGDLLLQKRQIFPCMRELSDQCLAAHPEVLRTSHRRKLQIQNMQLFTHRRNPSAVLCLPGSGRYYMIIGAQTKDKRGCALIYSSEDLQHGWTFAGELKVPGFENFGDMWECPSIERLGGRDVLLLCPQHMTLPGRGGSQNHNGYILGTMDWDTLTFTPDGQFHVLDFGFDSYAAACANNLQEPDKAILIAWMGVPDVSYPTDEEDWSGCLTLPRELTVRRRRLIQQPLPELKKLREEPLPTRPDENGVFVLPKAAEIEVDVRPGIFSLSLFAKADGSGGLTICCDEAQKEIKVNRGGMETRFNLSEGEERIRPGG